MLSKPRTRFCGLLASAITVAVLIGCNGSTGPQGAKGDPGSNGTDGQTPTTVVDLTQLTSSQFADLNLKVTVNSVTVNATSPKPVVNFTITDAYGHGVTGLDTWTSASGSLTVYPNLSFTIAKLIPENTNATARANSRWVNYMVISASNGKPGKPGTDNAGTLVAGTTPGNYTYTFFRDITAVKGLLASASVTAPNNVNDLDDVTFDPTLTHRLIVGIAGYARNTGTNTATGAAAHDPYVFLKKPVNAAYDFVPSTTGAGRPVTATDENRDIVDLANCNSCHGMLGSSFHANNYLDPASGPTRVETKYCVTCHTDQRKYGTTNSVVTAGAYPTGTGVYTYRIDDHAVGEFTAMVHRIHRGKDLALTGYNYANVKFNDIGYSILDGGEAMCSKCHTASATAPKGDNWTTNPTRMACGACHDDVNFATSVNHDAATPGTVGLVEPQLDDNACRICHTPAKIMLKHQLNNVTPHNPTVPTGLVNFTYKLISATAVKGTSVAVKFEIDKDGTPVSFVAAGAGVTAPLTGFTGSPAFLLAYAQTQDGVTAPADYNNYGLKQGQPITVSIADLLNTSKTIGTLTNNGDGTYTANITDAASVFPAGATLCSVSLQAYFTQAAGTGGITTATARHAKSVVIPVTGDTVRRTVVDSAKCASCHEFFEGHGGNRNYEVQVCVQCHNPALATSGRTATDAVLKAYSFTTEQMDILKIWGFDTVLTHLKAPGSTLTDAALSLPVTSNNFKDMIHGIHAGKDRPVAFQDARVRGSSITLIDESKMGFPGILNNCETCHNVGTYSSVPAGALLSTHESKNATYAATPTVANATASLNTANADDVVVTPFAAACVSCHNSTDAKNHMTWANGSILVSRTSALSKAETCVTCHGPGTYMDPVVVHAQ
jgi:OmcA/MtrC family decaheme c-type cytochrome